MQHLPLEEGCILCEGKIFRLLSGQIPQRRGLLPAQQGQQNPLRHGPPAVHSFRRHRQFRPPGLFRAPVPLRTASSYRRGAGYRHASGDAASAFGSTGGSIGIDKIQSLPVHRQSRSIRGGVPAGFRPGRQADAGQAEAVDQAAVRRSLASPLASELQKADRVEREFRFSLLMPGEKYFPELDGGAEVHPKHIIILRSTRHGFRYDLVNHASPVHRMGNLVPLSWRPTALLWKGSWSCR